LQLNLQTIQALNQESKPKQTEQKWQLSCCCSTQSKKQLDRL
jgi:hypothetical protein